MWILLVLPFVFCQWTPSNYPNPRKGGYKECKMRSVSNVCDPDEILTEGERYRLNSELVRLSGRTEESGNSFCARKGVDPVLIIMQDAIGDQQFADELKSRWNLDGQCEKSAIFLLCAGDRKLYYSGESGTGITPSEFQAITSAQEIPLRSGQYVTALVNIFKELGKKSNPLATAAPPQSRSSSILSIFVISFILPFIFWS